MASENPFFFVSPPPNPIFSNINWKETLTDSEPKQKKLKESISLPDLSNHKPPCYNSSNIAESSRRNYGSDRDRPRVYQNFEEEIEERTRLDLAAMWPVISANTNFFCIDDAGIAVQIAEANKAFAAAIKAVAAANKVAAAVAAATAPRMEQLKLETKALLDSQTRLGSVYEYPELSELDHKKLSNNACKALEHYKETNGEEYEFVENKKFENGILPPFLASHITFTAKPKEKADSCPKLFFAELYRRFGHDDYEVKMCMNLDSCSPDIKKGCDYIHGDKDMLHPSGVKFWAGPLSGTPEWDEWRARNSSSRT